jgi:hypothetical protein
VLLLTENHIRPAAGVNDDGDDNGPFALFIDAMKSKETEEDSVFRLRFYFNFHNIPGEELKDQASNFVAQIAANSNPKWAHNCLNKYARHLKSKWENKELKSGTVRNYIYTPKLFY